MVRKEGDAGLWLLCVLNLTGGGSMAAVVNALSLTCVVAVAVVVILMLRSLMRLVMREDLTCESYVRCGVVEGWCLRRECQCPSYKEVTTKEQVPAIRAWVKHMSLLSLQ